MLITSDFENGCGSMERLDDAVNRLLTVKEKMGMFKKIIMP